jgi:hypothetical protein
MKYKFIVFISALGFLLACGPSRKVTYEFPATMSGQVREGYIAQFNKGRVLFELNCAKCHNRTVRGREIIPDFTSEQLSGYEMRIGNEQHMENLPESRVTEDELVLVLTFLRYKKKIGYGIDSTGNVMKTK